MTDMHPALQRKSPDPADLVPVDIYRRADGCLLIHSCPDDCRAVPIDSDRVGCALLLEEQWTRRLGCPLRQAKGAVVPRDFTADLIAQIHVIG